MQQRPLWLVLAASAALGLLTACADINDTGRWALSTRVPAYAIVNDQLVQGDMLLYTDHTGVLTLRSDAPTSWWPHIALDSNPLPAPPPATTAPPKPAGPGVLSSCMGRMHFTATNLGRIDLRCNDGAISDLRVALIGETRGYGYGQTATGVSSLTFGMSPTEARAHLTVPAGKDLQERTDTTGLELK